jgi:predicted O-methyltransferase YrrM
MARAVALGLACADYWLPRRRSPSDVGPLNGQRARVRVCEQLAALGRVHAVVETGTCQGATTVFLARLFETPLYSVEINPRFHYYARLATHRLANVRLTLGDSREFLRRLASNPDVPKRDVLFYLDAHRQGDQPLLDELELICENWRDSLIMIDDFEVSGDPGYRFNDYAPGVRFGVELLPAVTVAYRRFYPAISSREETGARRGCIILAPPGGWAKCLSSLSLVREGGRC